MTLHHKVTHVEDSSTRPLILVTSSVDKMVLRKPIKVDTDLTIAGAVTWVGRSSMEIQLEVTQSSEETSDPSDAVALTANFTFVARDSKTGKSAVINQISPETEKEKVLWNEAEERNKLRKKKKGEQKKEINDEDMNMLNKMLSEGRVFCDMPALVKPVDVGNFLRFNSCVLYTELENPAKPLINVEVVAHVMRPELRSSEVSNKFYFTFTINSDALKNGHKIRNVVPATEEEARRVIERMEAERSY